MSIIGILKIMEVQEDDMEVQEEAVLTSFSLSFHIPSLRETMHGGVAMAGSAEWWLRQHQRAKV